MSAAETLAWARRRVLTLAVLLALPVAGLAGALMEAAAPDGADSGRAARCEGAPLEVALLADAPPPAEPYACRIPSLAALPCAFAWAEGPRAEGACRAAPQRDGPAPSLGAVAARETAARVRYAYPAALLLVFAVPFLAVSGVGLRVVGGPGVAAAGLAFAAGSGLYALLYRSEYSLRLLADLTLLRAARAPDYPFLTGDGWLYAFSLLDVAFTATMAACAAGVALLATLALRDDPDADAEARRARVVVRAFWFRIALIGASITLALGVATAHGLMHWPARLLAPPFAEQMTGFASAATLYWGVLYSTALALFAAPCAAALRLDIAALEPEGPPPGERALLERSGLDLNLRHAAGSVTTVAAPLLTGPALDILTRLLEA